MNRKLAESNRGPAVDTVPVPGQVVGEPGLLAPDQSRTYTLECVENGEELQIADEQVKQFQICPHASAGVILIHRWFRGLGFLVVNGLDGVGRRSLLERGCADNLGLRPGPYFL